ncbi:RNA recognition motif [Medicago truncatula]|uniref:RNA recognition motif n=1 Tax=Medicago truncatula TaxID=3880 RepID=G7J8B7_MEDTR|nr:RNA recognition motif [Medicago truncatula]
MTDPYYPYPTPAPSDGASFARSSYAGYIPSEAPSLASPLPKSTDFPGYGSDYLNKDVSLFRMEPYGVDDTRGSRVHSEHNATSYNPLEDVDLSTKRDALLGVSTGVPDPIANNERSISKSNYDALPVSAAESNILFVGGLPKDCTRREVGRILCHLYVCLYALVYLFLILKCG